MSEEKRTTSQSTEEKIRKKLFCFRKKCRSEFIAHNEKEKEIIQKQLRGGRESKQIHYDKEET